MSNINLIDSFQEFKDFKNIDRPTMSVLIGQIVPTGSIIQGLPEL